MAAWTPGLSALIAIGKGVKGTTHSGISDNITALAEGASGAPSIEEAALAASIVSQGKLKTATGEVSHNSSSITHKTLPGGSYGFYPQIRMSGTTLAVYDARILDNSTTFNGWTSYVTKIGLAAGSGTIYAEQRYVQASPPYDLGDGEIPLFVFAVINGAGEIESIYTAPDPPWANNGPTDPGIVWMFPRLGQDGKPDGHTERKRVRRRRPAKPIAEMTAVERTVWFTSLRESAWEEGPLVLPPEEKNADMGLIPHPFGGNDLTGKSVVLINPVGTMAEEMAMIHITPGESVNELLHEGDLVVDNMEVARATPPGVLAHPVKWKNTL